MGKFSDIVHQKKPVSGWGKKCAMCCKEIHSVVSQKMDIFIELPLHDFSQWANNAEIVQNLYNY